MRMATFLTLVGQWDEVLATRQRRSRLYMLCLILMLDKSLYALDPGFAQQSSAV